MRYLSDRRLLFFILISIWTHIVVMTTALWLPHSPTSAVRNQEIEVVINEARDLADSQGQIVEQEEKALNNEIPKDTHYLSRNNQVVKTETRARNHGDFQNSGGLGGTDQQPTPQTSLPTQPHTAKTPSHSKAIPTDLKSLRPDFIVDRYRAPEAPKNQAASRGQDVSRSNDYLKDAAPSLQTMLNTREFVYYTYYARIRERLRQYWEPQVKLKVKDIYAQGRSLASTQDRITQVLIILNRDGKLESIHIVGPSGLKDLDEAALAAFRLAAPFPNPPSGIIEPDGKIRIRWDFVLEARNPNASQFKQQVAWQK